MDRTIYSFQRDSDKPESRNRVDYASVISNYLTDWFRGVPKQERTARLEMVQETKEGSYKIFDYDGPAKNLGQIKDAMDRFYNERQN